MLSGQQLSATADVRLTAAERRGGGRSGDGTGRYVRRLFVFWLLFFLGSLLFCHRNHSITASARTLRRVCEDAANSGVAVAASQDIAARSTAGFGGEEVAETGRG